jgi:hypothetical protein
MSLEHGKLDTTYTLRIPSGTKAMLDRLTDEQKTKLNNDLRLVMARALHDATFNPNDYLCDHDQD